MAWMITALVLFVLGWILLGLALHWWKLDEILWSIGGIITAYILICFASPMISDLGPEEREKAWKVADSILQFFWYAKGFITLVLVLVAIALAYCCFEPSDYVGVRGGGTASTQYREGSIAVVSALTLLALAIYLLVLDFSQSPFQELVESVQGSKVVTAQVSPFVFDINTLDATEQARWKKEVEDAALKLNTGMIKVDKVQKVRVYSRNSKNLSGYIVFYDGNLMEETFKKDDKGNPTKEKELTIKEPLKNKTFRITVSLNRKKTNEWIQTMISAYGVIPAPEPNFEKQKGFKGIEPPQPNFNQ